MSYTIKRLGVRFITFTAFRLCEPDPIMTD